VKQEYIDGLGQVHLVKRKQSRRISVRYDPRGILKVSLPRRVSYQSALHYLVAHKKTIHSKICDLRKDQFARDLSGYSTRYHRIEMVREERKSLTYHINQGTIWVKIPAQMDIKSQQVQSTLRTAVEEALRMEAKNYLPQRLNELASQHNLSFNRLFIKKVQSLWGSCSSINNINLNIHLMRLPDHLIDYVLLHELCHTIYKNHSSYFWNHLQTLMNRDVKTLRAELNDYSPKLF